MTEQTENALSDLRSSSLPDRGSPDKPDPIDNIAEAAKSRLAKHQITGCRWIDGDVQSSDWSYCQRPRLPGRSYCSDHHARSINPMGDDRFLKEQAECESDLRDLPPPDEE